MTVLAPLLPKKYAPLRPNGAGLQSVYLTFLPETFAMALVDLLGAEARDLVNGFLLKDGHIPAMTPGAGLLLTPSMDHLFDRGFISFESNGQTIISPVAHVDSLRRMGLDPLNPPRVGTFPSGQKHFLEYHRDNVLLRSTFMEQQFRKL